MSWSRRGWAESGPLAAALGWSGRLQTVAVREEGPVFGLKTQRPGSLEQKQLSCWTFDCWKKPFIHSVIRQTLWHARVARCRGQGAEWPAPIVPALVLARRGGRISHVPEP